MTTSTPGTRPDHTPLRRPAFDDDRGSATAEYAVVILVPRLRVSPFRLPPRSLNHGRKHTDEQVRRRLQRVPHR